MKILPLLATAGMILCCLPETFCSQSVATSANPPKGSYRAVSLIFTGDGNSQKVGGALVTPVFFQSASIKPWLGRVFVASEYKSGKEQVVVLSHRFWKEHLGGDPHRIGSMIRLSGKTFTVLGVMPPSFEVPPGTALWMPTSESALGEESGRP